MQVTLKDPKDWELIGQPVKRLDTLDKLTGKQVFGADFVLPGMVNAAITACPVHGGKRKSFDAKTAEAMPGVKSVVAVGDNAVAVVADTWWQAKTAMDAVEIEWDAGESGSVSSASINEMLTEGLTAETKFVGNQAGDFAASKAGAAKVYSADYSYPFQNHATMEPMNATAIGPKIVAMYGYPHRTASQPLPLQRMPLDCQPSSVKCIRLVSAAVLADAVWVTMFVRS